MPDSALLVMDFQTGVVERFAGLAPTLLPVVARAADAARRAGVAVIYVRVGFRPGAPEVSRRNRVFAAVAAAGMDEDDPATAVHDALAPHPGDVVVTKRRVSAFAGSDLDVVLRALEVRELVLTGIATSGVVLSTVRQAADLDFELTVLRDGCADADPEVHRVLLDTVFPRQARVIDVDGWIASLAVPGGGRSVSP